MATERKGLIKFAGVEQTVVGEDLKVGQKAPEFSIQKIDWSLTKALKETKGKVRIIASVPSLDTPVCDRETRRLTKKPPSLAKMWLCLWLAWTCRLPKNAGAARLVSIRF